MAVCFCFCFVLFFACRRRDCTLEATKKKHLVIILIRFVSRAVPCRAQREQENPERYVKVSGSKNHLKQSSLALFFVVVVLLLMKKNGPIPLCSSCSVLFRCVMSHVSTDKGEIRIHSL